MLEVYLCRVEYAFMRVGIMVECSHVTLGSRLPADVRIYVTSCLSIRYIHIISTQIYNQKLMYVMRGAGSRDYMISA